MKEWKSDVVNLSGHRISYHRTGGNLPPLLMAHGLTDSGLCWTRVARALETDFDIIMLDARGHGFSDRIGADARDDHGADVAAVINALKLERPAVLGHSVGATSMAMFANLFPQLTSRVVLEDPLFMPVASAADRQSRNAGFQKQVEKFADMTLAEIKALGRETNPAWHEDEINPWAIAKQQVDENVLAWFDFLPWRQTIDRIESPTLIIYGEAEKGGIVKRETVREAQEINKHIRAALIEGAGHNIHRERFEKYISVVREFLL